MRKFLYQFGYRFFKMPWELGAREELISLVKSGKIKPGRAIDLGCGTGDNAVYLAQNGFEVTGVDFSSVAVEKAKQKAKKAGVKIDFLVDDLTNLKKVEAVFDFFLDYSVFDDLSQKQRDLYLRNVLLLTHSGTRFFLWCFEWKTSWWEKFLMKIILAGEVVVAPGEIETRFGPYFQIEKIVSQTNLSGWPKGFGGYLMERKNG